MLNTNMAKGNMEYEIRFYYPSEQLDDILRNLRKVHGLNESARCYEKTIQFDHPCAEHSFYSKEIDGRFRIRFTKTMDGEDDDKCMISWKRRLSDTRNGEINKEEEVEITIRPEEYDNLIFILEKVLKMKLVESYERYRTRFIDEEVEIAVDEYPFGVALEIENKSQEHSPEVTVKKWVEKLGLDAGKAYQLSWDDKYAELCEEQGIKKYNHVKFGSPMPKV